MNALQELVDLIEAEYNVYLKEEVRGTRLTTWARYIFINVAHSITYYEPKEIMRFVNRDRAGFYVATKARADLYGVDKEFTEMYVTIFSKADDIAKRYEEHFHKKDKHQSEVQSYLYEIHTITSQLNRRKTIRHNKDIKAKLKQIKEIIGKLDALESKRK
jgi:hypothetical protein